MQILETISDKNYGKNCFSDNFVFLFPSPSQKCWGTMSKTCVSQWYRFATLYRDRGGILNTLFKIPIIFCHWLEVTSITEKPSIFVMLVLMSWSSKKASKKEYIPAKTWKDSLSMYTKEITTIINNCLENGLFSNELKLSDVPPVSKKDDDVNNENYRPVSILSHMSKVFEKIFYKKSIVLWHQSFHLFYKVLETKWKLPILSFEKSGKKILIKEMKLVSCKVTCVIDFRELLWIHRSVTGKKSKQKFLKGQY